MSSSYLNLAPDVHILFILILLVSSISMNEAQQQVNITQTTATLSEARSYLAATSSSELVFFGGGLNATGASDRVDICNVTSGIWTTATLSVPRSELAATSSGNLVFFAGGWNNALIVMYQQVDIYNMSNGSWSTATLSQARYGLAATSVGSIVLFAGGFDSVTVSSVVDVYNVTSNMWTTASLSQARSSLAATSVANRYAVFAGGSDGTASLDSVDIFDSFNRMWNTTTLSQARSNLAAASIGNLALFGGGQTAATQPTSTVDIFNSTTQTWRATTLSQARCNLAAASIGEIAVFGGGTLDCTPSSTTSTSFVDVYNGTSGIWFVANLTQSRQQLAATSTPNKIFFGGGQNNTGGVSDIVDVFDFSFVSPPSSSSSPSPSASTSPTFPPSPSTVSTSSSTAPVSSLFSSLPSVSPTTSPNSSSSSSLPLSNSSPFLNRLPATTQLTISLNNNGSNNNNNSKVAVGVSIGVVASLIVVVGVVILVIVIKRKKRNKKQRNASQSEQQSDKISGSDIVKLKEFSKMSVSCSESHSSIKHSQISFADLVVEKEIGEGSFGKVCLGKWNSALVALKFCRKKGNIEDFMREAQIMIGLPPHPNVVQMFGVSIDGPEAVLILEYCAGGSLDSLLFDEHIDLSTEEMLRLIRGIAAGMFHLHKHNIVHRDLAARNILLTSGGEPKISDFGMSRVLEERNEGKTYNNMGPIRWMAPESIKQRVYSKQSDVWSFGIVGTLCTVISQCKMTRRLSTLSFENESITKQKSTLLKSVS
jgi:predicted Ser/Thr protein kinase